MRNGFFQLLKTNSYIEPARSKKMHFSFTSCMGVFLGDIMNWWVSEFRYTYCNTTEIQLSSAVMVPLWSAASGNWENYHVTGEHMPIANLFLNNFTLSLKCLPVRWEFGCLNTGKLGVYWCYLEVNFTFTSYSSFGTIVISCFTYKTTSQYNYD